MNTSDFFFIISAIYIAPHLGETKGIIFSAIFCGLAIVFKIIQK